VRLLLDESGRLSITSEPHIESKEQQTVTISKHRTRSDDLFLRHKTTNRSFYNAELEVAREAGHLEVLFRNERDELTEGAISNLFVEKIGILYTPPTSCGLLAGTLRQELIADSKQKVEEKALELSDLKAADNIYVGNSVMGLVEVHVVA
jgi:para-aminobenzoate synthetase/4-amino-4-deoxychorismate lyase